MAALEADLQAALASAAAAWPDRESSPMPEFGTDGQVEDMLPWRGDDDESQLEWDERLLEEEVEARRGMECVLVVDGLPQVPADKAGLLEKVILRIFGALGTVLEFDMPVVAGGNSQGFAFVEMETVEQAEKAMAKVQGKALDKTHKMRIVRFSEFDKFAPVPDEYEPPAELMDTGDNIFSELQSWLVDPRGADQYVQSHGKITEVVWNDSSALGGAAEGDLEVVRTQEGWTDLWVDKPWSPRGTYLTTIHPQGVQVWGGADMTDLIQRFEHPGVQMIDWSPGERYLVTASPKFKDAKNERCIIIWELRSGEIARGFNFCGPLWPVFSWSADDKFFGKRTEADKIQVYTTPEMGLLENRSILVQNVQRVAWAPALTGTRRNRPMLAYSTPEVTPDAPAGAKPKGGARAKKGAAAAAPKGAPRPANVTLIDLPNKSVVQAKNVARVTNITLHWHPDARFLCAKVHRHSKSGKVRFTQLEFFRVQEKGVPVETLEVKDEVLDFAWEPQGNRFSILHTDDFESLNSGGNVKPHVSFYDLSDGKLTLLKTEKNQQCNQMIWSPAGTCVVLAGLNQMGGALNFYNADLLESMGQEDHYTSDGVAWDPTGRFVTSVVSSWKHKLECGYNLYAFSGKVLRKVLREGFSQLVWRPRPPTPLSPEQLAEIKQDLPKLMAKYREQDAAARRAEMEARKAKLNSLLEDFDSLVESRAKPLPEIEFQMVEEWVMDLVETREKEEGF